MSDETKNENEESTTFKALAEQELKSTLAQTEAEGTGPEPQKSKDPTIAGPHSEVPVVVEDEEEEVGEVTEEDVEEPEEEETSEEDSDGNEE